MESNLIIKFAGISNDWRTNKWRITCKCGKQYEPETTIFSHQTVTCPKCNYSEVINYNKIQDELKGQP